MSTKSSISDPPSVMKSVNILDFKPWHLLSCCDEFMVKTSSVDVTTLWLPPSLCLWYARECYIWLGWFLLRWFRGFN